MKKLVTTAMVAVLGLFGAIDDGRVTLVSSASAQTPTQLAQAGAALRARINTIANAKLSGNLAALAAATQSLENYLATNPFAASMVADVMATLPPQLQANIAASVGEAMGKAQQSLIANGSPASLQAAAALGQEVQQMPPALLQAVSSSFLRAGGNPTYSASQQLGGSQQEGNPPGQEHAAQQQQQSGSQSNGGAGNCNPNIATCT